jgi:hypothetical protein
MFLYVDSCRWLPLGRACVYQDANVRCLETVACRQHLIDGGDIVDAPTKRCLCPCKQLQLYSDKHHNANATFQHHSNELVPPHALKQQL